MEERIPVQTLEARVKMLENIVCQMDAQIAKLRDDFEKFKRQTRRRLP